MEKAAARPFSKVLGLNGIPDKQQISFHVENSDGVGEMISLPISESLALIEMIAAQHGAFSAPDRREMSALSVKWFELGRDQDKNLVLVLTLRSGGKLTFSIPRGLDSPMSEVLTTNASLPRCEEPSNLRNNGDARRHLPQSLNKALAWGHGFRIRIFSRSANSRLARRRSREIRTFWYSIMTLGTAIGAVGMLTHDGLVQQCELIGGLAMLMFSLARLHLLKARGQKRRGVGA